MGFEKTVVMSAISIALAGCAGEKNFPLRDPMWRDGDLVSVRAECHREPTARDPKHVACAPRVHDSRLYWDGMDNLLLRPLSEALGVVVSGEAIDVNSVDEVPDSAWFTNRIGRRAMTPDEIANGACTPDQMLDPNAPDGSWVIDKGKAEGATAGFRIQIPGKGKYMIKAESVDDQPERQAASEVIGAAIFHAAGYNVPCEQVIYVRPSVFKLTPGLRTKPNFGDETPFDAHALDAIIAKSPRGPNGTIRMSASSWVAGHIIGPFDYKGTRDDDPNDVIAHEDRRELRGMRVLASWINRYDTRRGNTLDTWLADDRARPDSSPGHVVHYQLDTSETIGGEWPWEPLSRRLGYDYVVDWGDMGADFLTLGLLRRPWDHAKRAPGHERFGFFTDRDFHPDAWRNAYPNAAYSRASERDKAWMARILARFTPEAVDALARAGRFTDPSDADYLAHVLRGRLDRILARYLLRLSPITDLHVDGDRVCGVDLAELRGVRAPDAFRFTAREVESGPLPVSRGEHGEMCATIAHVARSYVHVEMRDGVAEGKLVVHVYDLGARGLRIAGVERPSP
jgi:hypothetical protein